MFNRKRVVFGILCLLLLACSVFSFAACKEESFNISFKVNDEIYQTVTTNGEEAISIPQNPTKDGYNFAGWYLDKDVWSKPFTADTPVSGDLSVYAKLDAIEYTATFMDGEDRVGEVKFTVETEALDEPDVPTHPGYTGVWESYTLGMESITVNAVYSIETYDIIYHNVNGGATHNNPQSYDVEKQPLRLEDASKDGSTFEGWYSDAGFASRVTEIATGTTGELHLYAKWLPLPKKNSDIKDISKVYFGENHSSVTINLANHINKNGRSVTYSFTCSDSSLVDIQISGDMLTLTLLKGEGNADVSVSVMLNEKELFGFDFNVEAKSVSKVACIGDSLTYGHEWANEAFPVYLKTLLGNDIAVGNFGHNGAAVTEFGKFGAYSSTSAYTQSMSFSPDVIIIMLGTNDSKVWDDAGDVFKDRYKGLIGAYRLAFPNAEILLVTSPPTIDGNSFSLPNDVIRDSICPIQRAVAREMGVQLLDLRDMMEAEGAYTSMIRSDGVHLSQEGANYVAELIAEKIWEL